MAKTYVCDWCNLPIGGRDSQARTVKWKPFTLWRRWSKRGHVCGRCLAAFRMAGLEVNLRKCAEVTAAEESE